MMPTFLYKRGRRKVLKSLLERPHIYHSTLFKNALEAKARENMKRELENL